MSAIQAVDDFDFKGGVKDLPISGEPKAVQAISKMINTANTMIAQAEYGIETTTSIAISLADDEEAVSQLEAALFKLLDNLAIVKARSEILTSYADRLRDKEEIADIVEDYDRQAAIIEQTRKSMTKRQKFKLDENYVSFRGQLWEATNPDDPSPAISHFLPREDGDESDEDEFEIGGQTQTYRCPMTLLPLENAVTSSTCKHSYSRGAIVDYIGQNRGGRAICPVAGCDKEVTLGCLQADNALQDRADKFMRRQNEAEDEGTGSDEDVV